MRVRDSLDHFRTRVSQAVPASKPLSPRALPADESRRLLESILITRHLDWAAQELREAGHGHYTIASAGHEGNVVLGSLTRTTDLALLHYRDAAVQVERSRQISTVDPVNDILLSLVASKDDPLCRGRHKALGNHALGIIPQTSTIASHLPRAVGLALGLARRHKQGKFEQFPKDAVVLASFGDASINHSTALGAFNAASFSVHQNLKVPLLAVCEDNGLGISVRSPEGWVETRLRALPHWAYFFAEGYDVDAAYRAAESALEYCRRTQKPATLHIKCFRLLGHAGSDVDTTYRTREELEEAQAHDPLLCFGLALVEQGRIPKEEILALEAAVQRRVQQKQHEVIVRPKLESAEQIMAAIADPVPIGWVPTTFFRSADLRTEAPTLTLAAGLQLVLECALDADPDTLIFGEDVGKKGGVYGITKGLVQKAGPVRVFNTLLDEQTILGLALGLATLGFLPIPEIQYLAYLHNAEDQLRGEAATLGFFSDGAFSNPMLVRVAGLGYQKGFGGHFHNDNSLAVLRDIPGIIVGVPARADDALAMYKSALGLIRERRRVVVMVEPIALYHTKDLYEPNDGLWLAADAAPAQFGRARVYRPEATDLTILTYGNGVHLSLQAAKKLSGLHHIEARVVDLRWLVPLPDADILEHVAATGRALVVDECRPGGNVSEGILALLALEQPEAKLGRVTAENSFIALGEAANLVLVQVPEVVEAGRALYST
ncbi:MAG: thiamine pyrophosphate-dependent enzyme [Polyangiaceae bacterium]|nr:thiamine pyrophosphate-dependent enzyme [Polyangiaceae bacterium]